MKFPITRAVPVLAMLAVAPSPSNAEILLQHDFDQPVQYFSGTDGFVSRYCDDPWTTSGVEGLSPLTDRGCQCEQGQYCDYGMWIDGGYCYNSDPLDNHIVAGDTGWTDYVFESEFRNSDDDTMGFVFRYANSGSYYLLTFSQDQAPDVADGCNGDYAGSRLVRIQYVDQVVSSHLLATSDKTFEPGKTHGVSIRVEGNHILVRFGKPITGDKPIGDVLFDVFDDSPNALPTGKVGFFAFENGLETNDVCQQGGCWFRKLRVKTLPPPVPDIPVADVAEALPESLPDIAEEPTVIAEKPVPDIPPTYPDLAFPDTSTGPPDTTSEDSEETSQSSGNGLPVIKGPEGDCSAGPTGAHCPAILVLLALSLLSFQRRKRL